MHTSIERFALIRLVLSQEVVLEELILQITCFYTHCVLHDRIRFALAHDWILTNKTPICLTRPMLAPQDAVSMVFFDYRCEGEDIAIADHLWYDARLDPTSTCMNKTEEGPRQQAPSNINTGLFVIAIVIGMASLLRYVT
jgi:hypothetical protein